MEKMAATLQRNPDNTDEVISSVSVKTAANFRVSVIRKEIEVFNR